MIQHCRDEQTSFQVVVQSSSQGLRRLSSEIEEIENVLIRRDIFTLQLHGYASAIQIRLLCQLSFSSTIDVMKDGSGSSFIDSRAQRCCWRMSCRCLNSFALPSFNCEASMHDVANVGTVDETGSVITSQHSTASFPNVRGL